MAAIGRERLLVGRRYKGLSGGNGNIFFEWDSGSMGVNIFQISSNYTLKICTFFIYKLYFKFFKNKNIYIMESLKK